MSAQPFGGAGVTVTIFGREIEVSSDDLATVDNVLALVGCHESLTTAERRALGAAAQIVRRMAGSA